MVLNTVGIVLVAIQDSKLQILLQRHRDGCWGLPEQKITSESSLDDTALNLLGGLKLYHPDCSRKLSSVPEDPSIRLCVAAAGSAVYCPVWLPVQFLRY